MRVMAVLSVNVLTANMLLSVLFVSGALACQTALYITAPKKMEALSGSCLQIPCSFVPKDAVSTPFDSRRNTIGLWLQNGSNVQHNVVFSSDKAENKYPMKMIGNLSEKNCTTLFSSLITSYTGTYYFRIDNDGFMATAVCNPLQLTVRDSPPSPTIQISGDLKEKESVTVTCSAFTPCPHSPPQLTWNLQQDAPNKIEENTDGTFTTKIQKTITLSDKYDGYNIICSANYSVNEGKDVKTAEERKTLSVSYAPKNTSVSISPSDLVTAGSRVSLTCSSRANPPVSSFTWFKNSKDGPKNVFEGRFYSFTAAEGAVYYCVATNKFGNQTSAEIPLNIGDAPKNASVSISPSDLVTAGSRVNLTCSSRANPPVSSFTWFKNSTDGPKNVFEGQVYSFTATEGAVYYCVATNKFGNQTSAKIPLNIGDAPKNTSVSISPSDLVTAGSRVNLTCSSRANPPVSSFTWFKNSKDGPIKVFEGQAYSFTATQEEVFYCVATNELGNQTSPRTTLKIDDKHSLNTGTFLPGSISGVIVLIILLCIAVCVWWLKSKHQTSLQTQDQEDDKLAPKMSANKTEENIHYGEIDFSKIKRQRPSDSVQGEPDTVYAQVKVSQPANSLTPISGGAEDLCAQVRKDISKIRLDALSDSVQDSGEQQDVFYAQCKVSKTANSLKQTAEDGEDLYAQVKKK